jgi:hypothetical protein
VRAFLKDMGLTVDDVKKNPALARQIVAYHTIIGKAGPKELFEKADEVDVSALRAAGGADGAARPCWCVRGCGAGREGEGGWDAGGGVWPCARRSLPPWCLAVWFACAAARVSCSPHCAAGSTKLTTAPSHPTTLPTQRPQAKTAAHDGTVTFTKTKDGVTVTDMQVRGVTREEPSARRFACPQPAAPDGSSSSSIPAACARILTARAQGPRPCLCLTRTTHNTPQSQGNVAKVAKASAGTGAHTVHVIDKVLYSGECVTSRV